MTSTLTPESLQIYAATLRARTDERRQRRECRRRRAWDLAREAAALLRDQYGAHDVWVFGSLLDSEHFTEHSDIDMAVGGLDQMVHLEALGRLLGLSPEFEFDLVDLEHCPPTLREAVDRTGVRL